MRLQHEIVSELANALRDRDVIVADLRANAGKITVERYKRYVDIQDRIIELHEELHSTRHGGDDT